MKVDSNHTTLRRGLNLRLKVQPIRCLSADDDDRHHDVHLRDVCRHRDGDSVLLQNKHRKQQSLQQDL